MEEKNRKNPFWNAKLPIEERLDWLLANMTLEEKITCMASTMPELPRFGIDMSYVGGEAAHGVEARNDQNGRNIPEPTTSFPQPMLMYSKEANNRKQEIDRQHHTIPNQRANDKHHGNVYNLLFRYGKVRSQNMEKLKSSFPTFCKRTFPQLHKIASYAHYAQCRLLRKPSHFIIYSRK